MRELKTNTATRITVGPFLDKTDGITPEVAITVTSCKLTFVVDDAGVPTLVLDVAPTASGGANDMVHITGDDSGYYDLELAAANVNYLGRACLSVNDVAVHCPVFHEFMILSAAEYDKKYASTGAVAGAGIIGRGTMQAGSTSTTAVLAAATSYADDFPNGSVIEITGGTGAGQARFVDDWVNSTDTATVSPVWTTTPDNTSVYVWWMAPPASTGALLPVNVIQVSGDAVAADNAELFFDGTGYAGTGNTIPTVTTTGTATAVTTVNGLAAGVITATSIAADAITAAKIADGAIDAATFAAGAIDAAAIAANAIGASELAADAVTEIAAGVLTVALTESYAADGAAPTLAQAVFAIQSFLQEKSVSGTTLTCKKLDGSTTSMTFTLGDATTPTTITRAS